MINNLFLLNPILNKFENKVIYGAGKEGQLLCDRLKRDNVNITYFADSNHQIHGTKFNGIEVISLEQLKKINFNTAVLLSKGYQEQIYNMLISNGIKNVFLSHVENGIILED